MELNFLAVFATGFLRDLYYLWPILIAFLLVIMLLGRMVGRKERWSKSDALYFAFITASTVGYGDFRPRRGVSKFLAILISIAGLLLTGIVVAASLHALNLALEEVFGIANVSQS